MIKRKLIFTLRPGVNMMGNAIEIQTHRGGSLHIEPFQNTVYSLPLDESFTDDELVKWYDRYSDLGVMTRAMSEAVEEPKEQTTQLLSNPLPPSVAVGGSKNAPAETAPKPASMETVLEETKETLRSANADLESEVVYVTHEAPVDPKDITIVIDSDKTADMASDTESVTIEDITEEKPNFNSMSMSQLRDYCKEHGITASDMRSKTAMIAAIEAAQA